MKTKIEVSGRFKKTGTWKNKGWYYILCNKNDSLILSMKKFPTKREAMIWSEELEKNVVPYLKDLTERRQSEKYNHGGSDTINGFRVSYPPPYSTPMGNGRGNISKI